ncbi:MAG TPA: hypothetical protein VFJ43_10350, partial [Bacteroidia bacterium]|nr:hypothetical protein [Bacteroidia bacterium]
MRKFLFIATIALIASCSPGTEPHHPDDSVNNPPKAPRVKGPAFNADSAFNNIKTQVAFGPRIPDTKAHTQCADYFEKKLKSYGLSVSRQNTSGTTPID